MDAYEWLLHERPDEIDIEVLEDGDENGPRQYLDFRVIYRPHSVEVNTDQWGMIVIGAHEDGRLEGVMTYDREFPERMTERREVYFVWEPLGNSRQPTTQN